MAEISFIELAEKVIEEQTSPLSPVEIWEIAVSKGYDKLVASKGKTPWQTIGARIYLDIRDNPNSHFIKVDSTPKRFFFKKLSMNNHTPLITAIKSSEGHIGCIIRVMPIINSGGCRSPIPFHADR